MTEQQTPDREKKIADIRERLEKVTPGPWKWIDPGGLERKKLVGEWEIMNFGIGGVYDQVAGNEPDEDDAHLIANAPEWLRFLLDELERLKREIESHGPEGRNYTNQQVVELRLERERLIDENRKLREERDAYYNNARYTEAAFHEVTSLRSQLQSAQQEIERLRAEREAHAETTAALERVKADIATVMDQLADAVDERDEALAERDKLIEGLRVYLADLAERHHEAMQKWDREADMYEQGAACAYDIAESVLRDILKEIGVTVE